MRKLFPMGLCGVVCWSGLTQIVCAQNVDSYVPQRTPRAAQQLTIEEDFRTGDPRSVFSRIDRPVDELHRPRVSERNSHLGFEVRNGRGTFIATTSPEDAKLAEAIVSQTWGTVNKLADHFTDIHKNPDFGLCAVQVYINDAPLATRDEPAPVWVPGRFENRININVSGDHPSLAEQLPLLRAATAYVYMHVADFDKQLPQWVVDGFAQSAVLQHEGPEGLDAISSIPLPLLRGGQGLQAFREVPIELQQRMLADAKQQEQMSGSVVPFLLFGDDAAHAPEFFKTLVRTLSERQEQAPLTRDQAVRNRQVAFQFPPAEIDDKAERYLAKFDQWAQNPDATVPQFVGLQNADDEVVDSEKDLFILLKLANKLAAPPPAVQTEMRTKIVEFTKNGPIERPGQVSALKESEKLRIVDASQLIAALNQSAPGWTTVDSDGTLILSEDPSAVAQLVERYRGRVTSRREGDHWVWNYELSGGRVLSGWLEPRSKDDPRQVTHFEVRPSRPPVGTPVK